jgi:hypothetical protein
MLILCIMMVCNTMLEKLYQRYFTFTTNVVTNVILNGSSKDLVFWQVLLHSGPLVS